MKKVDTINSTKIIKKDIGGISIYIEEDNTSYYIKMDDNTFTQQCKGIFESSNIKKYGYNLAEDYVMLKELGINMNNIYYDVKIAAYDLNPTSSNLSMEM